MKRFARRCRDVETEANSTLESLTAQEIIGAVQGTLLRGEADSVITGVSTDTRTIKQGDLFFALKGNTDGHQFIGTALDGGAAGIIISDEESIPSDCQAAVIKVDDVLWALGDLAGYYRSKFDVRIVGVTGSVGKTTTKEMLASILHLKWKVLKNILNYNNEIGVPLTLFQLDRTHEVVVLEMAMRGLGEIRRLAEIAKPSMGVITNIGMSHIERLGSQGAIAEAKAEVLAELPSDGIAVLNMEDGYYDVMTNRYTGKVISFGSCKGSNVMGTRMKASKDGCQNFTILIEGGAVEVKMPILGNHNIYNALAAAAAAIGLGVDLYTVRDGLESFTSPTMRMELTKSSRGYSVINDAYNANPASMLAAIRTLNSMPGYKRKIAVLGDMLELGDYSEKAHRDVGIAAESTDIHILVTVGPLAQGIADAAKGAGFPEEAIQSYTNSIEAGQGLKNQCLKGDAILIKGSRGVKMEEIVKVLLDG